MKTFGLWKSWPGALALGVLLMLAGCSDGSSPSEPSPAPGAGKALLRGEVTSVSGAGAKASSVGGITVRIQGTSVATTTNAAGRFQLGGVPVGNQVCVFETDAQSAALPLQGVKANERIEMTVSIEGSEVRVQSMTRNADDGSDEVDLSVVMQPDEWDTGWPESSGTVSALITGDGYENVDLGSITLTGTDAGAEPLPARRVDRAGNHVRAFFGKADAFATLADPQVGEVYTITINLTVDGEPYELTTEIEVVEEDDELEASISLEKSTNGSDADSAPGPTITVGEDVEWEYEVTNTGEVELTDVTVTDDQGVDVSCPGDTLQPGDSMTCTGSGEAEAGQYSNMGTATGTSPEGEEVSDSDLSHYFGEEEDDGGGAGELSLQIQPDAWNTNWPRSSGTVSALIRGEGFEDIDLDSIFLEGTDDEAGPLPAQRADRAGNHVRAFFGKADAFALLDDPEPGEFHTVTVTFTVGGEEQELSADVRVVGSGK